MLIGLLLFVLIVVFALSFNQGIWSNTIALINAVTSGLIATNYFEPVTRFLSDSMPLMDYNWDVLVLGILFALSFVTLRFLTARASLYQVRFHPVAEQVVGGALAVWTGWVAVCFICFALHTAPLSRTFLGESFDPEAAMFFGTSPDRQWIGFIDGLSGGGGWGRNDADDAGNVRSRFDPKGEFLLKYASRRKFLEKQESTFYGVE